MNPSEIWTVAQAATYLKVHPMTLYKWIRIKKVPALRIGGCWRFHAGLLEAWFKDGMEPKAKPDVCQRQ